MAPQIRLEKRRGKGKWLLPGLPAAPPCASMQLSWQCSADHHSSIEGKEGRVCLSVCLDLNLPKTLLLHQHLPLLFLLPSPLLFSASLVLELQTGDVIASPLARCTCPAVPSAAPCESGTATGWELWERPHHCTVLHTSQPHWPPRRCHAEICNPCRDAHAPRGSARNTGT